MSDLPRLIQDRIDQANTRLDSEFGNMLSVISGAGVNLSQINSFGVSMGGQAGGGILGGSVTVTVLADPNNSSARQAYITLEGGLGGFAGLPGPEANIVAYQGRFNEYSGPFVGVQGSVGVSGQSVISITSGDVAFSIGATPSASAALVVSQTFTIQEYQSNEAGAEFITPVVPYGSVSSARIPGYADSGNVQGGYVGAGSYVGVGSSEASGAASSSSSSFSYQSNTHVTAFGGGASSAEDYYESNSSALAGSLSLAREQQTKEALRQAQDIVRRPIIAQIVAVLTETRRLFEPLARSFAAVSAQNFGYCHRNSCHRNVLWGEVVRIFGIAVVSLLFFTMLIVNGGVVDAKNISSEGDKKRHCEIISLDEVSKDIKISIYQEGKFDRYSCNFDDDLHKIFNYKVDLKKLIYGSANLEIDHFKKITNINECVAVDAAYHIWVYYLFNIYRNSFHPDLDDFDRYLGHVDKLLNHSRAAISWINPR